MLVAVTHLGILLAVGKQRVVVHLGKLDGFLRTVLYAGKAELTVAAGLHTIARERIVAARTDIRTNATTDATVGNDKVLLALLQETHFGIKPRVRHKSSVLLALLLVHGLHPMLPLADVVLYGGEVLGDMLVHLHLLVHVEVGQPAVHHYQRADVGEPPALLAERRLIFSSIN